MSSRATRGEPAASEMAGSPASAAASEPAYRRLSVSVRREQLISTAQRLFAQQVPDHVSLDDVARHAGVSRPLVYRYFPGGKQQLYEAALSSAAVELERCFAEPAEGPPSKRLANVLDRYLAFVDQHSEGFTALLNGGSVVETSRTSAIVDGVRRAAVESVLLHLQVEQPGPWLSMAVRTWVTTVEAASLIWLDDGKEPTLTELRDWLVDHCMAVLAVTATHDPETARMLRRGVPVEPAGGRTEALVSGVAPLFVPSPRGTAGAAGTAEG